MHPRQILDRYGIAPKQSLGQNFLYDEGLLARITAAAELPSGQLALFDDFGLDEARDPDGISRYNDAAQRLGRKHPGAFYVARVVDAAHPAPERRSSWTRLGAT